MHATILKRYFDLERWHFDLFTAMLRVSPRWDWQEMADMFMVVCCELDAPQGSASLRQEWMNHFLRLGYARLKDDKKTIEAGDRLPQAKVWLMKAVKWAGAVREVEKEFQARYSPLSAELQAIPVDAPGGALLPLLDQMKALRAERDAKLIPLRRSFRLAPKRRKA